MPAFRAISTVQSSKSIPSSDVLGDGPGMRGARSEAAGPPLLRTMDLSCSTTSLESSSFPFVSWIILWPLVG